MAVEKQSLKPSPPKSPPAVKPTEGASGQPGVAYGDMRNMKVLNPNKSEMSNHFTAHDGKASKPGKEASNEGTVSKAGKPGYK